MNKHCIYCVVYQSKMNRRNQGVLTFEWIVLATLLAVGIIAGVSLMRDSITSESGDVAEAITCANQEYTYSPISVNFSKQHKGVTRIWHPATTTGGAGYWLETEYDYFTNWLSKTTGSKMIDTDSASGNQHVYIDTVDESDK